ncbi:hypothetical protein [Vibrio parahaemolyticus]|uniref:hypothetical protein n=1 Tax=Vibrio parahaemolyticus TaxID=670 RepID=UPI0023EACEED|nr:hypothetical protein [Vibrio parahaemolyticus]
MTFKKIEINAGNFVSDLKDYIDGSGVRVHWDGETFTFKHKTNLFTNDAMIPSKMLERRVLKLFKTWFPGYLPKYNNVRNCFWAEEEHKFVVCVYDIDRRVHRYKILSTTSKSESPRMDEIMPLFDYSNNSPFKVIRFEKLTTDRDPELTYEEMDWLLWEALTQDSERYTVEFDSNDAETSFYLVDDHNTDAE